MTELLFDYLARRGFLRRGRVSTENIRKMQPSDITGTARELARLSRRQDVPLGSQSFQHAAALSLGGAREYCRNISCRTRSGKELVQFALLYSDRVFIRSYFAGHTYDAKAVKNSLNNAREDLIADIRVLQALRPAMEAGYVQLYTPPAVECPQCLANETFGTNGDKRLREAQRKLNKRFLNEVDADLLYFQNEWTTSFSGPEDLLGHTGSLRSAKPPDYLREYPGLLRRISKGNVVRLSKTVKQSLGLHHFLAGEVMKNVVFEIIASQQLGTSLLTDRKSDVDVLNAVSADPTIEERNRIALEYMTSLVPFVEDVPASALLRLRTREAEAFARYRAALNEAINSYRDESDFSVRRAKQLYGDVIEPKLAVLDQKFRGARRTLGQELRRDVLSWVGAISFGVYTGLLPVNLAVAAKGIGATALIAAFLAKAMKDPSTTLHNEQFYFLWRVRREAGKRK